MASSSRFHSKYEDRFDFDGTGGKYDPTITTSPSTTKSTLLPHKTSSSSSLSSPTTTRHDIIVQRDIERNYIDNIHPQPRLINIDIEDTLFVDNQATAQVIKDKAHIAQIKKDRETTTAQKEGFWPTFNLGRKALAWEKQHHYAPLPIKPVVFHDDTTLYTQGIDKLKQIEFETSRWVEKSKNVAKESLHNIVQQVDDKFDTDIESYINNHHSFKDIMNDITQFSQTTDLKDTANDIVQKITHKINTLTHDTNIPELTPENINEMKRRLYITLNDTVDNVNDKYGTQIQHTWDFIQDHNKELLTLAALGTTAVVGHQIYKHYHNDVDDDDDDETDNEDDNDNGITMSNSTQQLLTMAKDKFRNMSPKDVYQSLPDNIKNVVDFTTFATTWGVIKSMTNNNDNTIEDVKNNVEKKVKQTTKNVVKKGKKVINEVEDKGEEFLHDLESFATKHNLDINSLKEQILPSSKTTKKVTKSISNTTNQLVELAKDKIESLSPKDIYQSLPDNVKNTISQEQFISTWDTIKSSSTTSAPSTTSSSISKSVQKNINNVKDKVDDVKKDMKKGVTKVIEKVEDKGEDFIYDLEVFATKHNLDINSLKDMFPTTNNNNNNNKNNQSHSTTLHDVIKLIPSADLIPANVTTFFKEQLHIDLPTLLNEYNIGNNDNNNNNTQSLMDKLPTKTLALIALSTGAVGAYCYQHNIHPTAIMNEIYQEMTHKDNTYDYVGNITDVFKNAKEFTNVAYEKYKLEKQFDDTMNEFKLTLDTIKNNVITDEHTLQQFEQLSDQYEHLKNDITTFFKNNKDKLTNTHDLSTLLTSPSSSPLTSQLKDMYYDTKALFDGTSILFEDLISQANTPELKEKLTQFLDNNRSTIHTLTTMATPIITTLAATTTDSSSPLTTATLVTGGLAAANAWMNSNTSSTTSQQQQQHHHQQQGKRNNNTNAVKQNVTKQQSQSQQQRGSNERRQAMLASVHDFNHKNQYNQFSSSLLFLPTSNHYTDNDSNSDIDEYLYNNTDNEIDDYNDIFNNNDNNSVVLTDISDQSRNNFSTSSNQYEMSDNESQYSFQDDNISIHSIVSSTSPSMLSSSSTSLSHSSHMYYNDDIISVISLLDL